MTEQNKDFSNCMNEPINEFSEVISLDYLEGVIDYTEKMTIDMWQNFNMIYEKRLRDAFKGTGLKTSKRMEILELVRDLIRLSECYRDYLYDEATDRQTEILDDMNQIETSDDTCQISDNKTPCDYPDYDGHYSCPYDAQGGDDCRNFCGLGVDE